MKLSTTADITNALDKKIVELESSLSALRAARTALAGGRSGQPARGRKARRKLTAAEKAAISRRMKAAWKRRKQGKA